MTKKELEDKIKQLEARIQELEARPPVIITLPAPTPPVYGPGTFEPKPWWQDPWTLKTKDIIMLCDNKGTVKCEN